MNTAPMRKVKEGINLYLLGIGPKPTIENCGTRSKFTAEPDTGGNAPFKVKEYVYANGRQTNSFMVAWGLSEEDAEADAARRNASRDFPI